MVTAAAGAAAPPTSSATEVATTAVLAPAAGLQLAALKTGRPLEAPLALRSSGDDSKAAPLRQPLLWRHSLARGVFSFPQLTKVLLAPALGVAALPSESSPEERSASGALKGLPV